MIDNFRKRFLSLQRVAVFFTQSYGQIRGNLHVLDKQSEITDFTKYDHVVEGSVLVKSGKLSLIDCPTKHVALAIRVEPGRYRVRFYGSNFKTVKETDLWGDDDSDYYRIEIWPSTETETSVLKQYEESF